MTGKPSDYKTGREYRWAQKAAAKEQTATLRAVLKLALIPLIVVWLFTGSFLLGLLAAVGVPVLLLLAVVLVTRLRQGSR